MYSLNEIKHILGDDYCFRASKTIDEVRTILSTGEITDNNDVPFVLEAGNLDIEITIYWDEKSALPYLGYYCCTRSDGQWSSYDEIPNTVNLDIPDLEAEMFRVLEQFSKEHGLCFFAENEHSRKEPSVMSKDFEIER